MKYLHTFTFLLFLFFPAMVLAGTISGEVQDSTTGQPIANAHITIFQVQNNIPDSLMYSGITDNGGHFSIEVPTSGMTFIEVHKPDYMPARIGPFNYDAATSQSFLIMLLPAPYGDGLVSGNVYDDSTGLPVAGAEVIIHHANGPGPAYVTNTDAAGFFERPGIIAGVYTIKVYKPGYYAYQMQNPITVPPGGQVTGLQIYLDPFGMLLSQLSGTVYSVGPDSSVEPLQGCAIQLLPTDSNFPMPYITVSEYDGSYVIDSMLAGMYMVILEAPGHQPKHIMDFQVDPGLNTHDFYIEKRLPPPPPTLSGTVFGVNPDSSVLPLGGALIDIEGGNGFVFTVITHPDGRYFVDQIPPGTYDITVSAPGFETTLIEDFLITEGPDSLDVYLQGSIPLNAGTITGTVTFDGTGEPVAGANIDIIPNNNLPYMATTFTNPDGTYSVDVPAGEYFVHVWYAVDGGVYFYEEFYDDVQQFANAQPVQVVAVQTTTNIDFGIPPIVNSGYDVVINGTVNDGQGNPLPGAEVTVYREAWFDSTMYNAVSGADGSYSITIGGLMVPFAHFIVKAAKDNYLTEFYDEQPTFFLADRLIVQGSNGNQTFNDIDFTLDQVGTGSLSISGTVVDSNLVPMDNAFVLLINALSGWMTVSTTDVNGEYEFDNLANSVYFILFAAEGYVPEFYDDAFVWEDATPIVLQNSVSGIDALLTELPINGANGMVAGTVINQQSGEPVDGVLVTIMNSDGDAAGFAFTNQNGLYEVSGLDAGDYTVYASKVQFNSDNHSVSLAQNGMGTLLNFELESTVTGITDDEAELPESMMLGNNYPNPFNPETNIEFALSENAHVTIDVYNIIGQKVATLINDALEAGTHNVRFNAVNLPSGIYFYRMQAGSFNDVKKMILQK